ncbi:CTD nuclear envelope phosphatase 1 homolog isoform X2 [Drosophila eugracilis]|uniref:CTD nuclear envelope phosphatase 1 homolog isoform X2 n=1 Tax=Drosophila eugracilis TaxID=29029 RepID=UPI0007E5C1B6|nr:CTD nuclear envelope phosphatase 1 homolog isoform X2 [Drosophila eugracilis]
MLLLFPQFYWKNQLTMPLKSDSLMAYFYAVGTMGLLVSMICVAIPQHRLNLVAKKTLVLDMDETLITSWTKKRDKSAQRMPLVPHDFKFYLPQYGTEIYVYKRPHVDYFLDRVSNWYNLAVFTAGAKDYASPILDFLDNGRNVLKMRFYRENCIDVFGLKAKYVSLATPDLSKVLLLDNSKAECFFNVGNSINIKSYKIGSHDEALINLLPFLDALRFTKDVRSILQRCTRFECLNTILETVA